MASFKNAASIQGLVLIVLLAALSWAFYVYVSRRGINGRPGASQAVKNEAETTAKLLRAANAQVFGSKTCGFTVRQMERFGGYRNMVNYVECGDGSNPSCRDIQGFPTWRIGTFVLLGDQPIDKLRETAERVIRGEIAPQQASQAAAGGDMPGDVPVL